MRTLKLSGGMKFLTVMAAAYVVVGFFDPGSVRGASEHAWRDLVSLAPILGIVFVAIFLIHLFLKPSRVREYLDGPAGLRQWCAVAGVSMITPSPPYVLFPILGELRKNGMSWFTTASFLNVRALQVSFLPVMTHYFGGAFTAVFSLYVLLVSLVTSSLIGIRMNRTSPPDPIGFQDRR